MGITEPSPSRFLDHFLEQLCGVIGPRPAGTEADAACAQLVLRELRAFCDHAETQPFSFERWETTLPASLWIGARAVECYPFYGSLGTGATGIVGRAVRASSDARQLEVRAAGGTKQLALLLGGPFGPAVPRFDPSLLAAHVPIAGIAREACALVDGDWGQPEVELRFETRVEPGSVTRNVVGRIEGGSSEEVVIIAHLDTQYNTPGANDNAASLAVMLLLAAHYRFKRPRPTLTFLASGAEEIGCLGAREYVRRRAEAGTIGSVRLCVNFDSLTYGPHPQIYTREREPARAIAACYETEGRAAGVTSTPRCFEEPDTLDGAPFIEHGIPSIYLNTRGNEETLKLWHRPEDTPERVDGALAELSLRALIRYIDALEVP